MGRRERRRGMKREEAEGERIRNGTRLRKEK